MAGGALNGVGNQTDARSTGPQAMTPTMVVVGMGRSGLAAARLLRAEGRPVHLLESQATPAQHVLAEELCSQGIAVSLGVPLRSESLDAVVPDLAGLVLSPGISWNHPSVLALRRRGLVVFGEMELAWRALAQSPWIGITGTNGKTTITTLVGHLLRQAGLDAPTCGNIGVAASELALQRRCAEPPDWVVAELSSYQIEAAPSLAPRIGVWSNLSPDHLERHGTVERYTAIKASLLNRSAVRVLNGDDPVLREVARRWDPLGLRWITTGPRGDAWLGIEADQVVSAAGPLLPVAALTLPGVHNRQNLLLATAAALEAGLSPAAIEAGVRSFQGVPHRLEGVASVHGVHFINDSKATNYDAACMALQAMEAPVVLLAGGRAKQGEMTAWIEAMDGKVAAVVLFGEARELFDAAIASGRPEIERLLAVDLAAAVPLSLERARTLGLATVLLSPAAASFDQFESYEQRGDQFRELVLSACRKP